MITIGMCGRSGSGKSTVASYFRSKGIPVIDTDDLYHRILLEKGECVRELVEAFGTEILKEDGSVDRRTLASAVFLSDEPKERQARLNAITHRHVLSRVKEILSAQKKQDARVVFVDVPLLFESGFDRLCDAVICVVADEDRRIARISERDGIKEDEIRARFRSQLTDEYLTAHCDYVIENNSTTDSLCRRADEILKKIISGDCV